MIIKMINNKHNNENEKFDNNEKFNIYIITLPERKEHVLKFLEPFKKESDNIFIIDAIINENRSLGCTLSHKHVLELIEKNNISDINIILEDDIVIPDNHEKSRAIIEELIKNTRYLEPDILYGGYYAEEGYFNKNNINIYADKYQINKLSTPRCTHCYIINSNTAKKILKDIKLKINYEPIDEIIGRMVFEKRLLSYGIDYFKQPWQLE